MHQQAEAEDRTESETMERESMSVHRNLPIEMWFTNQTTANRSKPAFIRIRNEEKRSAI